MFGEKLVKLAKNNKNIVAITAAMTEGTGLTKFKEETGISPIEYVSLTKINYAKNILKIL